MSGLVVLTGGAGFVGSRLLRALNQGGCDNVLVVDNLDSDPAKLRNLDGLKLADYIHKDIFIRLVDDGKFNQQVDVVFHQGACTDTLVRDEAYMMANNTAWSKRLLHWAVRNSTKFVYASSAAVYGLGSSYSESERDIVPLNIYGYSKLMFDRHVETLAPGVDSTMVGLRYFNVYGPGDRHKGRMASMVTQFADQVKATGVAKLFGPSPGYAAGEQTRDFVHVDDVVALNLHFWQSDPRQGVVNAGTGVARTWNDLARAVVAALGTGRIEYVPFPAGLLAHYQTHTQADLSRLRSWGCPHQFRTLEDGVAQTLSAS
ncbi:MAG: ADP-glyceromanno-heptose 6-epimerase [Fimbriimonadaceae bacterium]|nr:ADP-glyceromanno-heptose 6-epimerase [Fimbriimonadaceae bacterium]